MSIQSGCGAAAAAGEIIKFVEEIADSYKDIKFYSTAHIQTIPSKIIEKAESIEDAGYSGWY